MDDLASGDTVLIVNEDRSMALSSQTGRNHLIGKDVYIENDTVWAGYDATPLLLSHTADHVHWMLCPANRQYITVATAAGTLTTSNRLSYNAAATISITDGNATIQFIGTNKHNTIGFNADEPVVCRIYRQHRSGHPALQAPESHQWHLNNHLHPG